MKYFDKIYIINLKKHTERRKRVAQELDSVGWWNYEFIDAVAGSDLPSTSQMVKEGTIHNVFRDANGILTKNIFACSMSHRKAHQKFLKDGHKTCLIVEDDVKFMPVALKMMAACGMDQFHNELWTKDWECLILGCRLGEYQKDVDSYRILKEWHLNGLLMHIKSQEKVQKN